MSQVPNQAAETRVSKDVIIRPNLIVPDTDRLELLKEFVKDKYWEAKKNFKIKYRLAKSNGQESLGTVGYLFDPSLTIPDHLLFSIKSKHQFTTMMPPSSESPIVALVSLVDWDSVKDGKFQPCGEQESLAMAELPASDFIVTTGQILSELMNAWDLVQGPEAGERRNAMAPRQEPFEKAIFFERIRGLFTTHYCNEYFKLKLVDEPQIPRNAQHMVIRNNYVIYATPRLVASTGFPANLYKRNGKNPIGFWPPQLRRCGRSIYWSQHSGKELMRWKDSDSNNPKDAEQVCDLRAHGVTVRRIAASDSVNKDQLAIVANAGAEWRLLFFADVNNGSFIDLKCPLRSIDSAVVMNGAVYAMGCWTDSMFPDVMVFYENGKWSPEVKRCRDILPNAFFPLNGRLYLFANGLETIEVYDPKTNVWTLNEIPRDMNDICGFTFFDTGSDKRPAELRNEI